MHSDLILKEFEDLKNALGLLQSSIEKFIPYNPKKIYTPVELEYYDSLSFRFEKSVELTLNFFKGLELFLESKSSDTVRDRLLYIQKIGIIEDLELWIEARLLRNKIAHSYLPEQLKDIYNEIKTKSSRILQALKKIEGFVLQNISKNNENNNSNP